MEHDTRDAGALEPPCREGLFRSIYDSSPIAIEIYDHRGQRLDGNPAALALFGVATPDDVRDFNIFDDPNLTESTRLSMLRGETIRREVRFDFEKVRARGSYRPVRAGAIYLDMLISPLPNAVDGEPPGWLIQAQEVTERTQANRLREALRRITAAINSTLDAAEIVRRVMTEASAALGSDSTVVALREDKQWTVRYAVGLPEEAVGERFGQHEVLRAMERAGQEALFLPDARHDPRIPGGMAERYDIGSALVVPLIVRGAMAGFVSFNWHGAPAALGETVAGFGRELAGAISLALENARLYERARFEQERWEATVESMLDLVTVADVQGRAIYMNHAYSSWIGRQIQPGLDLEQHPQYYQIYKTDGQPFPVEELPLQRAALRGEEVRDVELIQRRPDGEDRVAVFSASPLRDVAGHVTGAVAVGRDVTEGRKLAAERERLVARQRGYVAELRASNEQLETMAQALQQQAVEVSARNTELFQLAGELRAARDELEQRVAERTAALQQSEMRYRQMFENNQAVKLLIDPTTTEIVDANQAAADFYGYTLKRLKGMHITDLNVRTPEQVHADMAFAAQEQRAHFYFQHRLASGEVRDVEVYSGPLDLGARRLLFSIIHDITERKRLDEELRRSREQLESLSRRLSQEREQERRFIARELYDEVGQVLAAVQLKVGVLERECADTVGRNPETREIKHLLDGALADLHHLAVDLRPASLERLGLLPALRQYLAQYEDEHGVSVTLEILGFERPRLAPDVEITLYRVIQEALLNSAQHAHATIVAVILERRDDRVLAIIEDNGVGFDVDEALRQGGLGLFGMQQRVSDLHGTLAIESHRSEPAEGRPELTGSTVYVEIPCGDPPVV